MPNPFPKPSIRPMLAAPETGPAQPPPPQPGRPKILSELTATPPAPAPAALSAAPPAYRPAQAQAAPSLPYMLWELGLMVRRIG
jgi:hypothetical protein